MSVKVFMDSMFDHLTGGQREVEVEGKNVSQCLEYLWGRFPDLKSHLSDKQGELFSDIGIFLNNDNAFPSQPVKDGDELFIVVPIGGG